MSGEEEVSAESEFADEASGFDSQLRGERPDVGQTDEYGTDDGEESDGLHGKRDMFRLVKAYDEHADPEYDRSIREYAVDIIDADVREDYVSDRRTCNLGGIDAGIVVYYQADEQQ